MTKDSTIIVKDVINCDKLLTVADAFKLREMVKYALSSSEADKIEIDFMGITRCKSVSLEIALGSLFSKEDDLRNIRYIAINSIKAKIDRVLASAAKALEVLAPRCVGFADGITSSTGVYIDRNHRINTEAESERYVTWFGFTISDLYKIRKFNNDDFEKFKTSLLLKK